MAVLASHGNQSKLLGTTSFDRGTGLQAEAIKEILDDWEITEKCVAMCCDTTASNTGKFSGACILLKAQLDRSLLWTACRHHELQVILVNEFRCIFASFTGPQIELIKRLKDNWQSVDTTKATSHLDASSSACPKENIEYARQSVLDVKWNWSVYIPRDNFEEMLNLVIFYIEKE